jgi:Spy/CpxP family protein refolding chaperone
MKTKLIILSVFFLTTLISLNVNSQNQKAPNGPHDCSYLDLTEAQKTKVEAIHLQKRTSLAEMRADLNVKKAELEKMRVTDASEKDINAKIDEIATIRANMEKQKVSAEKQVLSELTPEQQEKYKMKSRHKSKSMKHNKCDEMPRNRQHHNHTNCIHNK